MINVVSYNHLTFGYPLNQYICNETNILFDSFESIQNTKNRQGRLKAPDGVWV
jgi:hypothetical protein